MSNLNIERLKIAIAELEATPAEQWCRWSLAKKLDGLMLERETDDVLGALVSREAQHCGIGWMHTVAFEKGWIPAPAPGPDDGSSSWLGYEPYEVTDAAYGLTSGQDGDILTANDNTEADGLGKSRVLRYLNGLIKEEAAT